MLCILLGYSQLGSQVIFGLFQGPGLNNANFLVHAILPTRQIGQETRDSIIAGRGIIIKMDQGSSGEPGDFILHFTDEDWVQRAVTGHGAIAGWVYQIVVTDVVQELPPLHTEYKVEVPFIEVNNPEPMNLGLARILLQHAIDYGLPSLEGITEVQCIIQESQVAINDFVAQFKEAAALRRLGV